MGGTFINDLTCRRCGGSGEITYMRDRPGGPPAINTMACPDCRPSASGDVSVFSNEPVAADVKTHRAVTPMKPNRRSRRRAAALARRRR